MALGRFVYTASLAGAATGTAAMDIIEIQTTSSVPVVLYCVRMGQISDAGDAAAELLQITIDRATTSGSSGIGNLVPRAHTPSLPAANSTCEAMNTTIATGRTPLIRDVWNIQIPYLYQPPPEERIVVPPSSILVLSITGPADALTMYASMTFEEIL